nr:MAG TPA: hypothetical protein [Caudoviricetes sp.]DAP40392.1 MAG TPA: hypothetical protein [Caudoviricetes sp.]DAS18495.1 MAG TPA: hypothetical protein [Caudoviricetes sp.]DAS78779.1 MAG TPA: hypothetical protein [Caudoviricetes sp.]
MSIRYFHYKTIGSDTDYNRSLKRQIKIQRLVHFQSVFHLAFLPPYLTGRDYKRCQIN